MDASLPAPCHASHPKIQENFHSWRCPLCSAKLVLDSKARDAEASCPKLHSDDILVCSDTACAFHAYGNWMARLAATAGHNDPCRYCHCRGYRTHRSAEGGRQPRRRKKKDEDASPALSCASSH